MHNHMHGPSDHKGQLVQSGPHLFRIVNGYRVWVSPVPTDNLPDLLRHTPYRNA